MGMDEGELLQFLINIKDIGFWGAFKNLTLELLQDTTLTHTALASEHLDDVLIEKRGDEFRVVRPVNQLYHDRMVC